MCGGLAALRPVNDDDMKIWNMVKKETTTHLSIANDTIRSSFLVQTTFGNEDSRCISRAEKSRTQAESSVDTSRCWTELFLQSRARHAHDECRVLSIRLHCLATSSQRLVFIMCHGMSRHTDKPIKWQYMQHLPTRAINTSDISNVAVHSTRTFTFRCLLFFAFH
jgi:hypothetical protein